MSLSEFQIIKKFFTSCFSAAVPAKLGIGDDCALIDVPPEMHVAVSTDTLVEGVHFLENSDPYLLGHKALAVNLSDLAAMGAKPAWVSMALTIPKVDEKWLSAFSDGFFQLAQKYKIQLIGGDTTRGPLAISLTVMGLLPSGKGLKRSGAKIGDGVYVTGKMGSAGLGLKKAVANSVNPSDVDLMRYLQPEPCVDAGLNLLGKATSCIDVSDGLAADLSHILKASKVGAILEHASLPMSLSVKENIEMRGDWQWPYSSGDDYQLCFTMPETLESCFNTSAWDEIENPIRIGRVVAEPGLVLQYNGEQVVYSSGGYEHFK
ncbi:MAG: thiamine-monophosphate kinase [Cycloclasticus sp. symbiont of Poecilosclerida sp. M]|nr:MAG: thiamine-monophosphate kinase [Cycloclasticus sp. symbiont of Poecilosclerida sp. M]